MEVSNLSCLYENNTWNSVDASETNIQKQTSNSLIELPIIKNYFETNMTIYNKWIHKYAYFDWYLGFLFSKDEQEYHLWETVAFRMLSIIW
jgi:hypothetical protein